MTNNYTLGLINKLLHCTPSVPIVKYKHYDARQLPCKLDNGTHLNPYFSPAAADNKAIVPYGKYLGSSIHYKPYAKTINNMVNLPPILLSIFVGVVLSDGNLTRNKYDNTKFYFKQTLKHFEYF